MSELEKNKAGLQKKVSSVFKGVPVPQNNKTQQQQPSDKPVPEQKPNVTPKPVPADNQISKSSLISKLSQAEGSTNDAKRTQSAKSFPKPASVNQVTQSSIANKFPWPKESLKQTAPLPEETPFIEESNDGLWQQVKDKLFTPKQGVSPARQKAMVIMVPILAIIMIFAFRQVLSKAPHKTKGTEIDDTPVVSNANTGNEIEWVIPDPIKIVTRDPIQLPNESNTQDPNQSTGKNGAENTHYHGVVIIRDIVYSKDKPSAVIGSKIVYVGDEINNMTIVKINRDSIEFEKDGERWKQNVRDGKMTLVIDSTGQSEDRSESIE